MGKVLFIDGRSGGDWGMDLLFSGLVRNLGPENVIDWPPQAKHRTGSPRLISDPESDWGTERRSLSYAPGNDLLKWYNAQEMTDEFKNKNIDMIFVDERVESAEIYFSLKANWFDVPVVVVAGHDRFWNDSPEFVKKNYYGNRLKLMFVDNWLEGDRYPSYVRLYNWSTNFDHLWEPRRRESLLADKIYDICFMGYNSHPNRAMYVDHILKRWGHLNNHIVLERRPDTFESFVPKKEYFKKIAQSKICINLRGAARGGKAMRFYEIPYVGSCMLSERFPGRQIDPFVDGGHCLYFDDFAELDLKIDLALLNPDSRENIAFAGRLHSDELHSSKVRVAKMLKEIQGDG